MWLQPTNADRMRAAAMAGDGEDDEAPRELRQPTRVLVPPSHAFTCLRHASATASRAWHDSTAASLQRAPHACLYMHAALTRCYHDPISGALPRRRRLPVQHHPAASCSRRCRDSRQCHQLQQRHLGCFRDGDTATASSDCDRAHRRLSSTGPGVPNVPRSAAVCFRGRVDGGLSDRFAPLW